MPGYVMGFPDWQPLELKLHINLPRPFGKHTRARWTMQMHYDCHNIHCFNMHCLYVAALSRLWVEAPALQCGRPCTPNARCMRKISSKDFQCWCKEGYELVDNNCTSEYYFQYSCWLWLNSLQSTSTVLVSVLYVLCTLYMILYLSFQVKCISCLTKHYYFLKNVFNQYTVWTKIFTMLT